MLSHLMRILWSVTMLALLANPIPAPAETLAVPIFIDHQQLGHLLMRDQFTGPDKTARYVLDQGGCSSIRLSQPHLTAEGQLLRVDAGVLATIGIPETGGCRVISRWNGRTAVSGKPVLAGGQPLSVVFRVADARLYDQQHTGLA